MAKKKQKAKNGKVRGVKVQRSQDDGSMPLSTPDSLPQQHDSGDGPANDTEKNPSPFAFCHEESCLPEQSESPDLVNGCIAVAPDNVNADTGERLSFEEAFSKSNQVDVNQAKSRRKKRRSQNSSGLLSTSAPGSSGEQLSTDGSNVTNDKALRENLLQSQQNPGRIAKTGYHDAHPPPTPYFNYQSAPHMAAFAAYPPPYIYHHSRYIERNPWAQGIPEEFATPLPEMTPLPESVPIDRRPTLRNEQSQFYHQGLRNAASAPTLVPTARSHMLPYTYTLARHQQPNPDLPAQRMDPAITRPDGAFGTLSPISVATGEQLRLSQGELQSPQSEKLAFAVTVQSSYPLLHQYWPERSTRNDEGEVWVNKAVKSKRFTKRDGSQSIELTCQNGPSPINAKPQFQCQWL
jgi:hypothetical protein